MKMLTIYAPILDNLLICLLCIISIHRFLLKRCNDFPVEACSTLCRYFVLSLFGGAFCGSLVYSILIRSIDLCAYFFANHTVACVVCSNDGDQK